MGYLEYEWVKLALSIAFIIFIYCTGFYMGMLMQKSIHKDKQDELDKQKKKPITRRRK